MLGVKLVFPTTEPSLQSSTTVCSNRMTDELKQRRTWTLFGVEEGRPEGHRLYCCVYTEGPEWERLLGHQEREKEDCLEWRVAVAA